MDEEMKKVLEETVKAAVKEAVKETMETAPVEKPQKKTASRLLKVTAYIVGGAALTAGATAAMPTIISKLSEKMYTTSGKKPIFNDDWEPEYVEVDEAMGGKNNGNV